MAEDINPAGLAQLRIACPGIGNTQRQFAKALGVSLKTVSNWEQGRRKPSGPAKALLLIVQNDPGALDRALNKQQLTGDH